MQKEFNDTGTCVPEQHFMVDISAKLDSIFALIEKGKYFTINRPRQYGKTTVQSFLWSRLTDREDYSVIWLNLADIGPSGYENERKFTDSFLLLLQDYAKDMNQLELLKFLKEYPAIEDFSYLNRFITALTSINQDQKVVLIIDEVDQSSNNQLFLNFLALLRNKYLKRASGLGNTFHSIILAGVHDVKNLKLKIEPNQEQKFNSPWNIATDFKVDLSFTPDEIETMLADYSREKNVTMDVQKIAQKLFYYTSGYPFLVSKICKIIDEDLSQPLADWTTALVDQAVIQLIQANNTNFESLTKNLENNEDLYNSVYDIIIEGKERTYNTNNPLITQGSMYGIFRNENGRLKIHNRIYELIIYDYMSSKIEFSLSMDDYNFGDKFIEADKILNFEKLLLNFQEFMKVQYSQKDTAFIERNGRLIFLAFLKPILNGKGFDFKEVQISEEKRLDVVVTYLNQKYVVELKLWRGPAAHQKGLLQLADYLERQNLTKGFLLIFHMTDPQKKEWKNESLTIENKAIFSVWV